jgi:hypothetical protein
MGRATHGTKPRLIGWRCDFTDCHTGDSSLSHSYTQSRSLSNLVLFFDADGSVEKWVATQLGADNFGPARAIGIVSNKQFLGGVVYHKLANENVEMTIAAQSPKWATRAHIRDLFAYPFVSLKVARISTIVNSDNQRAIDMNTRLGFVREGVLREFFKPHDAVIFGMLQNECKWIK